MRLANHSPASTTLLVLITLAALSLSGCAVMRSEPARLNMPLPQQWNESALAAAQPASDWWKDFNSAELTQLVDASLAGSPDLIIATERVRQAEAAASIAGASLFPSLGLSASSSRRRTAPNSGATSLSDGSNVSLGINYEVDLWGRLSAGRRAADASLEGSRFDRETVRLTLVGGVASAYFQVLATRARLQVARSNLEIAERLFRIVDVRYRNGAASALDVSLQQTTVLTQRATIPPLEVQQRQAVSALAILVGHTPQGFTVAGEDIASLAIPDPGVGLPSELLTRRPDLASAETQLRAADANVDAARAALLPSVQLSGSAGVATSALFSLSDPTRSLSLGASLAQTLFDGGRLRSQVSISESQRRQLVESYRSAILVALKEVEDALSNAERYRLQEAAQTTIRDEARRSLALSELRLREGAAELADVLNAQRTLYSAQDQLAQLRQSRLNAAVDIVKSVGGGWQRNPGTGIESTSAQPAVAP